MADETDIVVLAALRDLRSEQGDLRALLQGLAERLLRLETRDRRRTQALEARLVELRNELELMRESELRSARRRTEALFAEKMRARAGAPGSRRAL